MNKQHLINEVSQTTGLGRDAAGRIIEAVLSKIGEQLVSGEEVRLVGFGKFCVGKRKPSTGLNPRTGEPINIASVAQPKFRPGKILKQMVS
ncbi:HU family DNA-binding protein [Sphingomonas sp. BIUV-7]|uniref:HU family DNA-binding protein n=2 Tax=Sphingomonas natans TaxID=3063330 RepID=A0ABT8YBL4_9SPHN|nr:HU family DNA-binding protein [Sphingomonas sp. BIUV-7]MDO6415035.1 HU family DNA-binding protein [Sphingomonas sp. BIUV-7]